MKAGIVIGIFATLLVGLLFVFGGLLGLRISSQTSNPPSSLPTPTPGVGVASPSPQPSVLPTPTAVFSPSPISITQLINHTVPFTAQAPFGQWDDPVFQDGCEEASILMAMHWVNGTPITGKQAATDAIAQISTFEQQTYGEFRDRSAEDTTQVVRDYFKYDGVELRRNVTLQDIKAALAAGNLVVIPADGQALNNPYFTAPGPERHMLLVRGYDPATKQFITNDPGTQFGEGYKYPEQVLFNAIRDYPTGYHEPITSVEKVMIVIQPRSE